MLTSFHAKMGRLYACDQRLLNTGARPPAICSREFVDDSSAKRCNVKSMAREYLGRAITSIHFGVIGRPPY